ncbi:glycosyltransferase [Winogradskyella sp.]|uniref:glycosyltransferase n=1 Tax=Winogradskyella sp. TaxID=1883156 RepID=UPI003BA94679
MKKIKIAFVLPTLHAGGAERVMSFLSENLDKSKFNCSLVVVGHEKNSKYNINNIPVYFLNKDRVATSIPSLIRVLKKLKPDIAISSISHINSVMGMISFIFPKTIFIGREANVLSVVKDYKGQSKRLGNLISPSKSYKLLDLIICQSKDMYHDMHHNFKVPKRKLRVINNPITDKFQLKAHYERDDNELKFITVAALKKQKGHERILRVLAKLNLPFQYTIVGNGSEKDPLFKLIEQLGLHSKIHHVPYTSEVPKYLAEHDFFLQGSYVEGFPNALIESCAVGTPVLAFDAPGGLNEIIEPEINGLVAENEDEYLENIIKASQKIEWNPDVIRTSVYKKFNSEKILKAYEDLFIEVLKK